jgi:anti-sigma regulatory factor (Ser/Thr protein kinase)
MDTVLTDEWLGDAEATPVLDVASVSLVREHVRREGERVGLSASIVASLVIVASELAHNQLAHARRGAVAVRECAREGTVGLEIIAADQGDGIRDPAAALRGAARASGSLGIGLAAVMELADEVDVDVRIGEGTCLWARKFAEAPSHRRMVGIYGTPHSEERVSGDHAAFARVRDRLVVALADGLGHGPSAREASAAAIATFRANAAAAPAHILEQVHGALKSTRGAVMAVVDVAPSAVRVASVGNVAVHVYGPKASCRFSASSFVLGTPGAPPRVRTEDAILDVRDAIVLFSDGLTTRASLDDERDILREPPIVIAHRMHERFSRGSDDALVLVAR